MKNITRKKKCCTADEITEMYKSIPEIREICEKAANAFSQKDNDNQDDCTKKICDKYKYKIKYLRLSEARTFKNKKP